MTAKNVLYFLEDTGHESFAQGLTERVAVEVGTEVDHRVITSSGGSAKVLQQLKLFVKKVHKAEEGLFDLLVVLIDANCHGRTQRTREVEAITAGAGLETRLVIGIPEPHVEKWILLDQKAVMSAVPGAEGYRLPQTKCDKNIYKDLLARVTQSVSAGACGGDVAREMDLDRAAKMDDSFRDFCDYLRNKLK